jgi:predicted nucleic acid-binding Zn ribbon protein
MSPWQSLPEPEKSSDPRPVRESLDRVAGTMAAPRASVLAAVFTHWDDIVGPSVAAHAQPVSLRGQVLVIGTDQPGWATQLRYLAPDLLGRLAAAAGEGAVERLEFKVLPPRQR